MLTSWLVPYAMCDLGQREPKQGKCEIWITQMEDPKLILISKAKEKIDERRESLKQQRERRIEW